ncbi:MAG: DUF2269 family protein [Actinomycetota bacterium]|nr:DUF2269 family protein [Actinomycetota bacterium]
MELRDVLLVIHIAGAGSWLGANLLQAVVPSMAAKQGVEAAAGWFRVAGELSKKFYMPVSTVLLATGIWMVLLDDSISFENVFVVIGIGMIVVGALLGIFVFEPGSEEAATAVESGDEARLKAAVGKIARFGTIDTLLLIVTISVMVIRLR